MHTNGWGWSICITNTRSASLKQQCLVYFESLIGRDISNRSRPILSSQRRHSVYETPNVLSDRYSSSFFHLFGAVGTLRKTSPAFLPVNWKWSFIAAEATTFPAFQKTTIRCRKVDVHVRTAKLARSQKWICALLNSSNYLVVWSHEPTVFLWWRCDRLPLVTFISRGECKL